MPWKWKNTNSPSSSSSSSSPSSSSSRKDFSSLFSRKGDGPTFLQPKLTRQRKLRYISDGDTANGSNSSSASTPISRTPSSLDVAPQRSSSTPVLLPQPLPLPGNSPQSPTKRDLWLGSSPRAAVGCPLPSPRDGDGSGGGDCLSSSDVVGR